MNDSIELDGICPVPPPILVRRLPTRGRTLPPIPSVISIKTLRHVLPALSPALFTPLIPICFYKTVMGFLNLLELILNRTGWPLDWALALSAKYPWVRPAINTIAFPFDSLRFYYWRKKHTRFEEEAKKLQFRIDVDIPNDLQHINSSIPKWRTEARQMLNREDGLERALLRNTAGRRQCEIDKQRAEYESILKEGQQRRAWFEEMKGARPRLKIQKDHLKLALESVKRGIKEHKCPRRGWMRLVNERELGPRPKKNPVWKLLILALEGVGVLWYVHRYGVPPGARLD